MAFLITIVCVPTVETDDRYPRNLARTLRHWITLPLFVQFSVTVNDNASDSGYCGVGATLAPVL